MKNRIDQGYIFLPKIKIFPLFTQNFSEIFNHKNWIYLVIFLSLWVFGKNFPKNQSNFKSVP